MLVLFNIVRGGSFRKSLVKEEYLLYGVNICYKCYCINMISFIFSVKPEDDDREVTRLGFEGYGCLGMFVRLLLCTYNVLTLFACCR